MAFVVSRPKGTTCCDGAGWLEFSLGTPRATFALLYCDVMRPPFDANVSVVSETRATLGLRLSRARDCCEPALPDNRRSMIRRAIFKAAGARWSRSGIRSVLDASHGMTTFGCIDGGR